MSITPAPRPAADPSTWSVIERAQAGDPDAFAEIYTAHRDTVYRYIRGRVRHVELAQDITHDIFVRALRSIDTVRWQGSQPIGWLMTIARNAVIDHTRSGRYRYEAIIKGRDVTEHDEFDTRPGPDEIAELRATRATVRAAIAQLPPKQRRVIELRYLADLTVEETCARTGWTDGVVKALTYRAVRRLGRLITRESVEASAA